MIVAVTTGMRQGEILALSWEDLQVDAVYPSLDVRKNLTRSHKGRMGNRRHEDQAARAGTSTLSPDAVAAFRRQKVRQLEAKLPAAWRGARAGLVFTDELGEHLLGWNVTPAFHALAKRAGIRECQFHDLRHTAASLWLQAGVNLKTVSKALGHTSIAITADVYGKVAPEQRRELAAVMAAITAGNRASPCRPSTGSITRTTTSPARASRPWLAFCSR